MLTSLSPTLQLTINVLKHTFGMRVMLLFLNMNDFVCIQKEHTVQINISILLYGMVPLMEHTQHAHTRSKLETKMSTR